MKASEKLDFLMKVTDTSNGVLGKQVAFDASYISRIRRGKRKVPETADFIEPIAAFFAGRLHDPYEKKIAGDMICPGHDWPDNPVQAQKLLYKWLAEREEHDSVGGLLTGLSSVAPVSVPPVPELKEQPSASPDKVQFFYGDQGKREAVASFLAELGQMEKPPQLLLYSNEEFNWMYEDPAFAKKWAMLLFGYIKKGGHIKIAHTISRASGEMLMALQKWIPVYMTGAIEPYYYPKILDRMFRKTMFIAEGYSAVAASSVGTHTEGALNCLVHDPAAVRAMEQEYWDFFSNCKPLMKIFNLAAKEQFLEVLRDFNADCENTITVRTTPSLYTMPDSVAKSMAARMGSNQLIKLQQEGNWAFAGMMERGVELTEILNLPAAEEVRRGRVAFPISDLLVKSGQFVTKEEMKAHLEQMIVKLRENQQYHVVLSSTLPANELIYVKEDRNVIVVKSDFPTIAFVLNEQRMVSAFWDYLGEQRENGAKKEKVLSQLEAYLLKLETE